MTVLTVIDMTEVNLLTVLEVKRLRSRHLAEFISSETSLLCLLLVIFSLCFHMVLPLCMSVSLSPLLTTRLACDGQVCGSHLRAGRSSSEHQRDLEQQATGREGQNVSDCAWRVLISCMHGREREATAPRNWFSGKWKCVFSYLSLNYSEIILAPLV